MNLDPLKFKVGFKRIKKVSTGQILLEMSSKRESETVEMKIRLND